MEVTCDRFQLFRELHRNKHLNKLSIALFLFTVKVKTISEESSSGYSFWGRLCLSLLTYKLHKFLFGLYKCLFLQWVCFDTQQASVFLNSRGRVENNTVMGRYYETFQNRFPEVTAKCQPFRGPLCPEPVAHITLLPGEWVSVRHSVPVGEAPPRTTLVPTAMWLYCEREILVVLFWNPPK